MSRGTLQLLQPLRLWVHMQLLQLLQRDYAAVAALGSFPRGTIAPQHAHRLATYAHCLHQLQLLQLLQLWLHCLCSSHYESIAYLGPVW